ncbi:MAG: malectin domain-containing carbohydrate-binding protein, partial [Candidatus Zhuqueibacterota bacterium]
MFNREFVIRILMLLLPINLFAQQTFTPVSSFLGTHGYERVGYYLHSAGDMNKDGYDDFMIGTFHNEKYGYNTGAVYLIMGKSSVDYGQNVSLSSADAIFYGSGEDEAVGYYLGGNGDINGDGYDDIVIGAGGGYIYLVFGKASPNWGADFKLKSRADASFIEENDGDFGAVSAAIIGDMNGDGYDDFICGAPFSDHGATDAGKAYVILGKGSGWDRNNNIAYADASFICGLEGYRLGYSVDGVGDVNGDGIPDFGILANWGGKVYIFFGRREVDWGMNMHVENADVILEREPDKSWYLWRVSRAGDVNNDGYDDILIGEPWNDQYRDTAGKVHLVLGRNSGWISSLSDADASFLGEAEGDEAGWDVQDAGDVNGDGYDDFLIGAWYNDQNGADAGKMYLIKGKASGWQRNVSLSEIDDYFVGEHAGDYAGFAVATAGDINADGLNDVFTSATYYSQVYEWGGKIYVFKSSNSEPTLIVEPTTLDFGGAATIMTFTVKNSGGGELDWTAAENPNETWIKSVTPASGSLGAGASQTVTVTVDRSGLSVGDYSGVIAVNSNGGAENVLVQMNVPGPAELTVIPTEIDFGSALNNMTFEVQNSGGGTLDWTAAENPNQTWITAMTPASGSLAADGKTVVTVTVSRSGLAEGNYSGTITVTSNGGSQNVAVSMTVAATPAYTQRVNCGGSSSYTDGSSQVWAADKAYTSGTWGYVGGRTYSTSHAIANTTDDALYQRERWETTFSYRFDVVSGNYTVILHFAEIYFQQAGQRIFDVSLEGSVVLNDYDIYAEAGHDAATWKSYQVSVSDGRLDIDFSTTEDAAKISAIEVLSATGAPSNPVLSVTPTTLNFGATTTSMTFTVKNAGGGSLDWTAAENPNESWITSVNPGSGSLGAGASQTVTVTVDRSGLSEGDYSGIIAVNSNGGAANVTVQMNVAAGPALAVNPTELAFGSSLTNMTFEVQNNGGGTLDWTAEENPNQTWITAMTPASGSLTADGKTVVTVTVSRSGLAEGNYSGTITVTSNAGSQNVAVSMTVAATPAYTQRVNCGGSSSYTDGSSQVWAADKAYTSGTWGYVGGRTYSTSHAIANTTDDALYQRERWETSFSYRFDVVSGNYTVILHFAEIYFQQAGQRIFDVSLEGSVVLNDYDIYAEAGHDAA